MGAWYLDNTRIILTDLEEENKAIIAKLNPLDGGTVHQYWGWEEAPFNLEAYVVGNTDKDAITSMERDGNSHLFVGSGFLNSDWNTSTTVLIEQVKWKSLNMVCQTIRPDLPTDSRVYLAGITLSTEEYPDS